MIQHHPTHWIAVAIAVGLALLTLTEVHGQTSGAGAMFEGRPALAGAQGGLGAQAGPPQGGIGLQGTEGTGLNLRAPRIVTEPRDMPQGAREEEDQVVSQLDERLLPPKVEPDLTPAQARRAARAR
jgi:hypothetical protein